MASVIEGRPPWSAVYRRFAAWRDACLLEKINHALMTMERERAGREVSPWAVIIDSRRPYRVLDAWQVMPR